MHFSFIMRILIKHNQKGISTMMALLEHQNQSTDPKLAVLGGLPVRTNLRAGLALDDLDDKAKELWGKLTSAVSGATSAAPTAATTTPTKSA